MLLLILRVVMRLQQGLSLTMGREQAARILRPWPMPLCHPALENPDSPRGRLYRECTIRDLTYRGIPTGRLPRMSTATLLTMLAVIRQLDGVTDPIERLVIYRASQGLLRSLSSWGWVYVRSIQRAGPVLNGLIEPHLSILLDDVWGPFLHILHDGKCGIDLVAFVVGGGGCGVLFVWN